VDGSGQSEISDALLVTPGVGFFSGGIVDQHFDTRARRQVVHGQSRIQDVVLHYLCGGDSWNLETGEFSFGDQQLLSPDDAYYAVPHPEASGVLSGYGQLLEFICNFLLDNREDCFFQDNSPDTSLKGRMEASRDDGLDARPDTTLTARTGTTGIDRTSGSRGYARSYLIGMKDGRRLGWELRLFRDPSRTQAWTGEGTGFRDVLIDVLPVRLSIEEFPD